MLRYIPFIFLFFFIVSCSSNTSEKTASVDSVKAEDPVNIPIADTAAIPQNISPEDTIKAIKVVYVKNLRGVPILNDMDVNSKSGYSVNYARTLDVIQEFPDWYKVRSYFGGSRQIFYILKEETSSDSPESINLHYPNFKILFKGMSAYSPSSDGVFVSEDEVEEGSRVWHVELDTLFMSVEYFSTGRKNVLQIIPNNKSDEFRVSYSFKQHVNEILDDNFRKIGEENSNDYDYLYLSDFTPFTSVSDSLSYYFTLPRSFDESAGALHEKEYRNYLKRKFQLKDTNIVYDREGDYGPYQINVSYIKDKRIFIYFVGNMLLKVERIVGGRVKEIRYLIIEENSGC